MEQANASVIKNLFVSIVIPVFNAEGFLEQCILSLTSQTLREIEIIVVNDGSTDNSKNLIAEFINNDSRIVYIENQNEGVSAARNAGIQVANGKYIGFVDADDFVDSIMFEKLYQKAEQFQADLVICDSHMIEGDLITTPRLKLQDEVVNVKADRESFLLDLLSFKFDYANWNKLYRTDILRKYRITFKQGLKIWEDILFNQQYIEFVNNAVLVNACLYHYRIHKNSVTGGNEISYSKEYNIWYSEYVEFCNRGDHGKSLAVFKKEAATHAVATILLLNKRSVSNAGFFTLFGRLKSQLFELNQNIYLNGPAGNKLSIPGLLLRHRLLTLFSFHSSVLEFIRKWYHKRFC